MGLFGSKKGLVGVDIGSSAVKAVELKVGGKGGGFHSTGVVTITNSKISSNTAGASGGNLGIGMFAQLNVQPVGARMYRSQVTEEEMRLATTGFTAMGQPVIDYEKLYPDEEPWIGEGKAGLPVLNMLTAAGELVHSDINAIIAGPNPDGTYPTAVPGVTKLRG